MQKASKLLLLFSVIIIGSSFLYPAVVRAQKPDTTEPANEEDSVLQANRKKNFTGTVMRDVVYSSNINVQGVQQQLTLDIYKPSQAEGKKYPLVLLIHGGGFKGGDKKPLGAVCATLADSGYVAASINYRLGWGGTRKVCGPDSIRLKEAIYRALQDAHAALDYLATHANEYSIDKDSFFIGGGSAGAVTALFTAYLSQAAADKFFSGIPAELGQLDSANRGESAYRLRGIISMWGAFADPQLITSSNALPTIFFQGEKDKTVPFDSRGFTPCPNASVIYGTHPLYNRLKDLDVMAVAHVDPNGGHGVYSFDFRMANILCFLKNVRSGNKKQIYLVGEQGSCDQY